MKYFLRKYEVCAAAHTRTHGRVLPFAILSKAKNPRPPSFVLHSVMQRCAPLRRNADGRAPSLRLERYGAAILHKRSVFIRAAYFICEAYFISPACVKRFEKIERFSLTDQEFCVILTLPVKKGSFFVRLFQPRMRAIPAKFLIAAVIQGGNIRRCRNARKNHSQMFRMQAEKLQLHEEQEERP